MSCTLLSCHRSLHDTTVGILCVPARSGVNHDDTQFCFALLVRLTSGRPVFRPIDCLNCSCLLATRTCLSLLATSLLHSTSCWDSNLHISYEHHSMLFSGLPLPLQMRLTVRTLRATLAHLLTTWTVEASSVSSNMKGGHECAAKRLQFQLMRTSRTKWLGPK